MLIRELVTKLTFNADTSKVTAFSKAVAGLKTRLDGMASSYIKGVAGLRGMSVGETKATLLSERLERAQLRLQGVTRALAGTFGGFAATLGVVGAALAPAAIMALGDNYRQVEFTIKQATKSAADFDKVMSTVVATSKQTGSSLDASSQMFQRLSLGLEGKQNLDNQLKIAQTVQRLSGLSAGSAESRSGALMQFGQAMGSTKVQAEEFNSLIDGMPLLVKEIASNWKNVDGSIGISTSTLIKMVKNQQVLSADVASALLRGYDAVAARVDQMPATLNKVTNRATIAFQEIIGGVEKGTGGFSAFYQSLDNVILLFSNNKEAIIAFFVGIYNGVTQVTDALGGLEVIVRTVVEAFAVWLALQVATSIGKMVEMVWLAVGAWQSLNLATKLATAQQILFNVAALANPFVWIPAAVVAFGYLIYSIVQAATGTKNWITAMLSGIGWAIDKVKELAGWIGQVTGLGQNGGSGYTNALGVSAGGAIAPSANNVSNSSKVVNNRIVVNQTNNNQVTGSTSGVAASTRRGTEQAVKSAFNALINVS